MDDFIACFHRYVPQAFDFLSIDYGFQARLTSGHDQIWSYAAVEYRRPAPNGEQAIAVSYFVYRRELDVDFSEHAASGLRACTLDDLIAVQEGRERAWGRNKCMQGFDRGGSSAAEAAAWMANEVRGVLGAFLASDAPTWDRISKWHLEAMQRFNSKL